MLIAPEGLRALPERGICDDRVPAHRLFGLPYCGHDGWAHLAALIDCHDQELIGHAFALRGRAKEAERALGADDRRGSAGPQGAEALQAGFLDNGLIYQSRRFRAACRDYRLTQEFITPYTPEQNGMIERFFRSLKEECVW